MPRNIPNVKCGKPENMLFVAMMISAVNAYSEWTVAALFIAAITGMPMHDKFCSDC